MVGGLAACHDEFAPVIVCTVFPNRPGAVLGNLYLTKPSPSRFLGPRPRNVRQPSGSSSCERCPQHVASSPRADRNACTVTSLPPGSCRENDDGIDLVRIWAMPQTKPSTPHHQISKRSGALGADRPLVAGRGTSALWSGEHREKSCTIAVSSLEHATTSWQPSIAEARGAGGEVPSDLGRLRWRNHGAQVTTASQSACLPASVHSFLRIGLPG